MKLKKFLLIISLFLSFINTSCQQNTKGRVYFNLDGGSFSDSNFTIEYIEGISNTPIRLDIPDPIKEGYTFVGWKEKLENGTYKDVRKIVYDDGKAYYFYPYGNSTLYAYYEPLISMVFHLTDGENTGEIIRPILGNYFSIDRLNGYTNLSLNSLDYLPTAKAKELTFEYWYLKKPLIKEDTDGSKRYIVDESKEEGEYRFDSQFNLDTMVFPYSESKVIDLYAKWTAYPTVTMNFGLDGINTYQFKAKNENITSYLNKGVKDRLNIDFSSSGPFYFIDKNDISYRFAGYYLDSTFKNQFFISSSIIDIDVNLYLKWEKQVRVTLDYNGGKTSSNKDIEQFNFYQNDIIDDNFFLLHTPKKDNTEFMYFAFDGKKYEQSSLLIDDITLTAIYKDDLTLNLIYDYPDDVLIKSENQTYKLKSNSDISSYLNDFKDKFNNDDNNNLLVIDDFYIYDINKNKINLSTSYINENMDIYLKIMYKQKLNIYSFIDNSMSLTSTIYLDKNQVINSNDYNLNQHIEMNNEVYVVSSYYLDENLSIQITFPISSEIKDTYNELNIYRKMSKAIKLSFYDIKNNPLNYFDNHNYLYVEKNSLITDEFKNMFEGKTLTIKNGSKIVNYFPSISCDIIVS